MKKVFFFIPFLICLLQGAASGQNPYQSLGKPMPKGKMLTLSDGKFQEFFPNDTLVPIGSVMYNTVTGQVVAFLTQDTLFAEYNLEPEVVSRWLSPDPLAAHYQSWSPYNYTLNNPIIFIDPDGRSVDNTIVSNASGTKQVTVIDDQPDAVAIYSDKEFDKQFLEYGHRNQYNTNIDKLRGDAMYLYMVDGMVELEKWAKTEPVNFTNEWYLDKNGKKITAGLYPEASASFKTTGNKVEVDLETKDASKKSIKNCWLNAFTANIHTHTTGFRPDIESIVQKEAGSLSKMSLKVPQGGDPTAPPSSDDWGNAINKQRQTPLYDAVLSPNHLHLYRAAAHGSGKDPHIIIHRSEFKKK
jgi:hypothetical protein